MLVYLKRCVPPPSHYLLSELFETHLPAVIEYCVSFSPNALRQFLILPHSFLSLPVVDTLHMPPTPPSSHGSDSEGSQSPTRSLPPSSPTQLQATVKVTPRVASVLTNSPLLTAPHVRFFLKKMHMLLFVFKRPSYKWKSRINGTAA